jgi:plasmid stabilization system protein ParE
MLLRIAEDSPDNAEKLGAKITQAAARLAYTPLIGRVVPEYGLLNVREIFVRPARILYVVRGDFLFVSAIVHHKRDLANLMRPEDFNGD